MTPKLFDDLCESHTFKVSNCIFQFLLVMLVYCSDTILYNCDMMMTSTKGNSSTFYDLRNNKILQHS